MDDATKDYRAIALEIRELLSVSKQPENRSFLTSLIRMYENLAGRPQVPANSNDPDSVPAS